MKKIIFVAGGTAGHVFAACNLANKSSKCLKIIITDKRGAKFLNNEFDEIVVLPISRLSLKMFFLSPYLIFLSLKHMLGASKVFFFGGYTCFFPFIAAFITKKQKMIVQLDSFVTRLNKILIPFANHTFYFFPRMFNLNTKKKTLITPLVNPKYEFSFPVLKKEFNIAVIGGSLGSLYWKKLLQDALKKIPMDLTKKINLYIQTTENTDFLKDFNLNSIHTKKFFETDKLFKLANLIIGRAGAMTIFEISKIGRPCFLVPWKNAMQDHQTYNKLAFEDLIDLKFENLDLFIIKLMQDKDYYLRICENVSKAFEHYETKKII